eukprot:366247-Chlamydomonas_euryale.AAC.2
MEGSWHSRQLKVKVFATCSGSPTPPANPHAPRPQQTHRHACPHPSVHTLPSTLGLPHLGISDVAAVGTEHIESDGCAAGGDATAVAAGPSGALAAATAAARVQQYCGRTTRVPHMRKRVPQIPPNRRGVRINGGEASKASDEIKAVKRRCNGREACRPVLEARVAGPAGSGVGSMAGMTGVAGVTDAGVNGAMRKLKE